MPTLIIQSGKHQGKKLVLPDSEVLFGRDEACQIRLASSDVSRQHCALRTAPEGMFVRDLGSRNGTLVNEVPVQGETQLKPGDLLRVGPMLFLVPGKKEESEATAETDSDGKPAGDDAIAAWLSGDAPVDEEAGPGETTIIPNLPKSKPSPSKPPKPSRRRKEFDSIADEAADIIRRHWERVDPDKKSG